jgi:tagaturonate reductase
VLLKNSIDKADEILHYPEKILQFGTGVLLRGLCDYFIDKANKQSIFKGRIVVVKSTEGGTSLFTGQDNLYTHFIKGVENGKVVDEYYINASISRVLSAKEEWQSVLECASNSELKIIISNTTEVGIVLTDDDIFAKPPASFPGKLLAFLHERYKIFGGVSDSGMVIIPTELIVGNGDELKRIVVTLARINNLEEGFIDWLENDNYFCNSLVDRIVPGNIKDAEKEVLQNKLGYEDDLMLMSEVYALWAIETANEKVKKILSFHVADENVILTSDITKFRELKLRILNGTHTYCCALALLCGFETVKQAVQNETFYKYLCHLMMHEIVPAVTNNFISHNEAATFAHKVKDRFSNPFIDHKWHNIALHYTSKMFLRNVLSIQKYYEAQATTPHLMALGFAAYLFFMQSVEKEGGSFVAVINNKEYLLNDEHAKRLYHYYTKGNSEVYVHMALGDEVLWQMDLNLLQGFTGAVFESFESIKSIGALSTIQKVIAL